MSNESIPHFQSSSDQNGEMAQYFNALPPMVQETIKQCGVSFSSRQELENYAANLMNGQG